MISANKRGRDPSCGPLLMLWTAPPRHESAIEVGAVRTSHDSKEPGHANNYDGWPRYREVSFSGAKSVFQVHGIDADGNVVLRRQLKRRSVLAFFQKLPPCLVGIEACASSHYWSRELQALGHTVRLMPPAYVKPYVKRQKNDMADAEAICEAVTRANMRFVPTKTPEQQSCLMLHRTRHLFIRQQTAIINSIRAHLAEFGIVAPVGRNGVEELLDVAADSNDRRLPELERAVLDGRFDLGLGACGRHSPYLAYEDMFEERQVLYCGRGHPLFARAGEVGIADLKNQQF